jgi:NADH-quinone oxidoreductase subunit N
MWTPDVYEGSPTPIVTFLVLPKIIILSFFLRMMVELFHGQVDMWQPVLGVLAFLSMVVGSFTALLQKNIKRILAYSTVAHMGYALLGVISADFQGAKALLTYMCIYGFSNLGVFACVLILRRQGKSITLLEDFKGLGVQSPFIAGALMVFLFSLAGIPPLAGFFAKLMVFSCALEQGFLALVIAGVLTSVVAAGFYLKIICFMYFEHPALDVDSFGRFDRNLQKPTLFFILLCLLLTLLYGVRPQVLENYTYRAVKSIFIKI